MRCIAESTEARLQCSGVDSRDPGQIRKRDRVACAFLDELYGSRAQNKSLNPRVIGAFHDGPHPGHKVVVGRPQRTEQTGNLLEIIRLTPLDSLHPRRETAPQLIKKRCGANAV
jgi:hypothetical protein